MAQRIPKIRIATSPYHPLAPPANFRAPQNPDATTR